MSHFLGHFHFPDFLRLLIFTDLSVNSGFVQGIPGSLSKLTPFIVSLATLSAFQVLKQAKVSVLEAVVQFDPGTYFPLGFEWTAPPASIPSLRALQSTNHPILPFVLCCFMLLIPF